MRSLSSGLFQRGLDGVVDSLCIDGFLALISDRAEEDVTREQHQLRAGSHEDLVLALGVLYRDPFELLAQVAASSRKASSRVPMKGVPWVRKLPPSSAAASISDLARVMSP